MYLVVSGRLQVSRSVDDSDENARMEAPFSGPKFAELGRGDTIGETTLMTGEPCPDTVVALRDSLVAALDRASFRQIAKDFPMEMLSAVSRQLNSRARQAASDRRYDRPPISIAILPLSHTADGSAVAARLERALETFGDVLSISPENPIVRNSSPASENRIVEWLNEQENHFRHVLYHIGNQPSRWARRALRQADRIFLLANAAERPADAAARFQQLLPVEAQEGESRTTNGRFHLVLLHDSGDSAATGTDAWLAAFPMVAEHHHLRLDHDKDFQRLARSVNDRLVGLALGGGFALGIAHVGVIRAMRDLDIPIDCVGGTSMGAIIGSSCALEIESQRMLDIVVAGRGAVRGDYTLPLLSVLTGAKFARMLGEHLGAYNIEDFWLPFFSVSASLRHARMVVHRRGDAVRSVLASCRAPVMFPPLSWNGDLLVDGGLVNNIPADVMRTMTPGGTVFAVDVSPSESIFPPAEESLATSGWRQIRRRWGSRAQARPEITLMEVLGRAIRLGGVSRAQRIHADTDCYLTPPLEQFKALDFSRGPAIEEKAFAYALHALGAWLQERGRPWESQQN
jgi:NTE family protein/lysophospholipid hydrolase